MNKKLGLLVFLFSIMCMAHVSANNVYVKDLQMIDRNTLQLTVGWENSWRLQENPGNHDAVWLFFKIAGTDMIFTHLNMGTNAVISWNQTSELEAIVAEDGTGIMLQRSATGHGHITGASFQIHFAETLPEKYILKVFAIEMVYVPAGSFWVGDSISQHSLAQYGTHKPFLIEGNGLSIANSEGGLNNLDGDMESTQFHAQFPSGYHGFYAMKYEISQQQYADFLNTLTRSQQEARTQVSPASTKGTPAMAYAVTHRNTIVIDVPSDGTLAASYACNANIGNASNAPDDGQWRAMNWLNWDDLTAYMDWAALRPMTETEYEKLSRGKEEYSVKGEFAWGTPWTIDANTLIEDGTNAESVSEMGTDSIGLANHGYEGVDGPLRGGFAAGQTSNRIQSGAGYYGAFELSGNVWEICVALNRHAANFDGKNGDGMISETGSANELSWPSGQTALGAIYRGGAWYSGIYEPGSFRDLAISDRFYYNLAPTQRRDTAGGRGAKTCTRCANY